MKPQYYTLIWENTETEIVPLDENPGHGDQGMLVYRSQEAAECQAVRQTALYGDEETGPAVVVPLGRLEDG